MRRRWRFAIATVLILSAALAGYVWILYRQLQQSFTQQSQFIPTRIYSDVTKLAPALSLAQVQARLQNLGYAVARTGEEGTFTFTLRPVEYPSYLIPEGHPTFAAANRPVTLRFDGEGKDALLQSIHAGENEVPELIATLSSAGASSIRALTPFRDIPAPVWQAIIAAEDQHFLEHKGLDPRGIARAIWVNFRTLSFAQGGSTITQQLVKNLMARRTKNVFLKANELILALLLETRFSKEEILERYLNEVYLGQVGSLEVHGVAEGAQHFFGKKLEELNIAEIALMAGLIRGPGFYSPYRYRERALERQRYVLRKMVETGHLAQAEAEAALKLPVRLAPPLSSTNKAPYFADFVKAELIRQLKDRMTETEITSAGFRVYSTLDMTLNAAAQRAVAEGVADLQKRLKLAETERLEGALAAVDHTSGHIRALVGGRSYAQSTFNRILNMKRQVGSTFKPFVFLSAFLKGVDGRGIPYGPGRPAEDAPWKLIYDRGRQTWSPKNYEKEFLGWIPLRTALSRSVNTVAARLGVEVGLEDIVRVARALGIESELPLVPSLSLGVAELSPVELLRAYATIANHGVQDELTVIRGITRDDGTGFARFVFHPKEVFPPGPIDLLTDVLQNVFIDGTARDAVKLGFDRPAAGKTGTTSHHRDAWFAGFTPQLTAVVWVGMDQPPVEEPAAQGKKAKPSRVQLTGAGSALPIWVSFLKEALAGEPPLSFPISPHLTTTRIDRFSGKSASWGCPDAQTSVEKFVIGQEPRETGCESLWPASTPETILE
jgi:penicillin-binding protein 1B